MSVEYKDGRTSTLAKSNWVNELVEVVWASSTKVGGKTNRLH